jgi:hypothetical protein
LPDFSPIIVDWYSILSGIFTGTDPSARASAIMQRVIWSSVIT